MMHDFLQPYPSLAAGEPPRSFPRPAAPSIPTGAAWQPRSSGASIRLSAIRRQVSQRQAPAQPHHDGNRGGSSAGPAARQQRQLWGRHRLPLRRRLLAAGDLHIRYVHLRPRLGWAGLRPGRSAALRRHGLHQPLRGQLGRAARVLRGRLAPLRDGDRPPLPADPLHERLDRRARRGRFAAGPLHA